MTDTQDPDRREPEITPPAETLPALTGEGPTVRLTRPPGPPPGEGTTVSLTPSPEAAGEPPPGEGATVPLKPFPQAPAESPAADDEVTSVLASTEPPTADEATAVFSSSPGNRPVSEPTVPDRRESEQVRTEPAIDDEPTVEAAVPVRPPRPADDEAVPAPAAEPSESVTRRESVDPVIAGEDAVPVSSGDSVPVPEKGLDGAAPDVPPKKPWQRLSSAGALIWVLLALFGFTLVVQLRSNNTDEGLATARQEDLVRILSDLEARDTRLQGEITTLEQSQRQLTSGVEGRQAALAEADKRADELGLLAGTLPGRGPGLKIVIDPKGSTLKASSILNAVQELRGAGGEVMEVAGPDGAAVRIVASSYFVDAEGGGIVVDGTRVPGPYTLWVIGAPQTMQTALQIPGGVVASVNSAGGSVTMEVRTMVEVTAVHRATTLQYARPVS